MTRPGSPANLGRIGVAFVALLYAIAVWRIVHGSGTFTTYAGRSELAAGLFVAAGLGLSAAGLVTSAGRPRHGLLAVLAGFVWFSPVLDGWEGGAALVREFGMLASGVLFAMLLHVVLMAAPRMPHHARLIVGVTYTVSGLGAAVLALVRDPFLDPHCWVNCTTNLFVVSARPRLASAVSTASQWFTAAAALALVAVCISWSLPATSRRRDGPLLLGGAFLGVAMLSHSLITIHSGFEDPSSRSFLAAFLLSCVSVVLIAGGLLWLPLYSRRVRRAVASVVASLSEASGTGSLESALANVTRDPKLRVSYWLPNLARFSDARGEPVGDPLSDVGTVATTVVRDGERIAVINRSRDATELNRVFGSDMRLALDNERLQAEVLAQMTDIRDSRSRIVEAGDERRRALERDLHDGAQQSLLGLSYDLRVTRSAATPADGELIAVLDAALIEVGQAFAELRDLAHGIFPAVLTQAGLAAAVASLAETSTIAVDVECTISERLPTAVQTAAYVVVADGLQAAAEANAASVRILIAQRDDRLVVDVIPDLADVFSDVVRIADRVGAVGGTLCTDNCGIRAEIPCGL